MDDEGKPPARVARILVCFFLHAIEAWGNLIHEKGLGRLQWGRRARRKIFMEIAVLLAIEASLFLIGVAVRLMLVVAQYGLAGMLRVLEAFFKRPLRTLLRIIQAVAVIGIILAATIVLVEHFAHHASFPAIWKELDAASIRPILRHQPINPDDAPEA